MIQFRAEIEYALLAALDLAEHYAPNSRVKVSHIAQRTGTPPKYLVQILLKLKAAALVNSKRGPAGGYWLIRRPHLISLAEIVRSIELRDQEKAPFRAENAEQRAIRALWNDLERGRYEMLSHISLADFLQRAKGVDSRQ